MGYMVLLHREDILLTRVEAAVPVESSVNCYKKTDCFEQSVSPAYVCLNNGGDLPVGGGRTTGFLFLGFYIGNTQAEALGLIFFFSAATLMREDEN